MSETVHSKALPDLRSTNAFAGRVARTLRSGETLGLIGPLGSGKTTFTKALVAALGAGEPVSSPTFVLAHEYPLPVDRTLEHWDLYRLSGLPEELAEPPGDRVIRVVEWPDKVPSYRLTLELWVVFAAIGPDVESRTITLSTELARRLSRRAAE